MAILQSQLLSKTLFQNKDNTFIQPNSLLQDQQWLPQPPLLKHTAQSLYSHQGLLNYFPEMLIL